MNAKEKHLVLMLDYWADPANKFITRAAMHREVLKISGVAFYKHFPPEELLKIEAQASELRRANSSRDKSEVMDALLTEAKAGNVPAAKEFLDRIEGKVPATVNANLTGDLTIELVNFCDKEEA